MLLSISEAGKLLGVCDNTLRDWDETGKFRAVRTEGGHRRYSLEQIREYLEENQTVEPVQEEWCEDDKFVNKWKDMLEDVYGEVDKRTLAILLENGDTYYDSMGGDMGYSVGFTKDEYLWITKESWVRTRFRKMVTLQPFIGPCGLLYFMKDNTIEQEGIAVKTHMYNFKMFGKSSTLKEFYAETIAAELDQVIFKMLPKINLETLQDAIVQNKIESLKEYYDYIIGPSSLIEKLKSKKMAEGVALFESSIVLDPESFIPYAAGGRYPPKLTLPIFSPYIIAVIGPTMPTGVRSCLGRFATYEGKVTKDGPGKAEKK